MKKSFLLLAYLVLAIVSEEVPVSVEVGATGSVSPGKTEAEAESNPYPRVKRTAPTPSAIGIKIKNGRNEMIDYYWDGGKEPVYQGFIKPRGVTATNSYLGHKFLITPRGQPETILHRINIVKDTNLYLVPSADENDPYWQQLLEEQRFMKEYFERTGKPWLAHYPRDPPKHHIWPATHIGQVHTITSDASYWNCIPPDNASPEEKAACQESDPITIEVEVVSLEPKVFIIKKTLSETEANLIIELSSAKIHRSRAGTDGGLVSNTRTSWNTWLGRKSHYVLDTVYRRAAHICNISDSLFQPGTKGNTVEELQVVHYQDGQEYTPHHDFGADGRPHQRYITLLFYLTDQAADNAGGETSFPKVGMKIHAGKGNSVMFYSLMEDGNADDLTLHAGTPVYVGEKWLANFWVWDPSR